MSTFSLPVFVSPPPPRLPPSPSLSPLAGPPAPPCLPPPVSSQPGTYGVKRLRPVFVSSSICVFSFLRPVSLQSLLSQARPTLSLSLRSFFYCIFSSQHTKNPGNSQHLSRKRPCALGFARTQRFSLSRRNLQTSHSPG